MALPDNIQLRMYAIMAGLVLMPVLVAVQLMRIYVADHQSLSEVGERQASSIVKVPALRGSIYDREGRELVVNTASYNVALDPTVDGFTPAVERTFFENMAVLTGKPASYFRQKVLNRTSPKYVLLWNNLGETEKQVAQNWKVPGLLLVRTFARRYNYGETASHVVGHVTRDGKGMEGLELYYQDFLTGIPGRRAVQRDRNGEIKAYVAGHTEEPVDGQDLYLTIDLELQAILEDELAAGMLETGSAWGVAIAMDPQTGAIRGMANDPFYDPNEFHAFDSGERRNRAIVDRLEPGSTFKLVTAVAAIESGIATLGDTLETGNGFAVVGGNAMHDVHGYGTITLAQAISKSSNIGLAKTGIKLDRGIFYQYARNLGFGQKTWIDLPGEVDGTLKKPKDWSGTSLASMSIGYEVDATPLQIITAYSALANGGLLMKPYVVAERRDIQGKTLWKASPDSIRRAFKRETARTLLPAFVDVVESGSAKIARIEGVPIAGKTGTAWVISDGAYDTSKQRASFVGFFPAEKPQIAILIMLARPQKRGNSGVISTPVFKRIAQRWVSASSELLASVPDSESDTVVELEAPMPRVAGMPAEVAVSKLLAAGFEVNPPETYKAFHSVVTREPEIDASREIRLHVATDSAEASIMPDLTGLSLRQAVHWSHASGIDVQIEGQGMVVSQSPKAGEVMTATATLRGR